jgi:hypothetical protein
MILLVLLLIFSLWTLTLTHVYLLPDQMILLVLLLIFPLLTLTLIHLYLLQVDTHEVEWVSRVGKINSKTSKIIKQ